MKKLVAFYNVTVKVEKDIQEEDIQELMTLDENELFDKITEKTDYFLDTLDACPNVETTWDELDSARIDGEDEDGLTEHIFFEY